jgi:hypothetical protein
MILISVLILLLTFGAQITLIGILKGRSPALVASILFLINAILFATVIYAFHLITDKEPIDSLSSMDRLIQFNSFSTHIRNIVVTTSLMALTFGLDVQYRTSKQLGYRIAACTTGILALLALVGSLVASTFVI